MPNLIPDFMGLTNKVIVFLGNTRFDSDIKATSLFIARALAKDNKVFFVDYPFTLKDYYSYGNSKEVAMRKEKFAFSSDGIISTDLPNLKVVITPPILPINFLPEGFIFRSILALNESFIVSRLKKIFKQENITEFIYINAFNFHYPNIAKRLKPTLSVYQCVDPMIVPYDMKHGIKSEDQLVKESDLVICTSKALYNEKILQNNNTYFVPNATEVEHFTQVLDPDFPVHEKLKYLPRPIIGYLGTIERRIDYQLLEEAAKSNPDKTFALVGPVWDNYIPEPLIQLPNVHVIGPVPYDDVPQIMKSFDIAIIPFKKDGVSNTIFPLKLFEYLSAGKPVIVTDFNTDLKEFTGDVVRYCSNAKEFSIAINETLLTEGPERVEERVALAKKNTWEKRAEQVANIISEHLEIKAEGKPKRKKEKVAL